MPYTPGPWFIQDEKRKDFIPIGPRSRSEDHIVAGIVCLERYNQKSEINISDACLISAAPELLEACMYLLSNAEAEGWSEFMLKSARSAIKKAEGERQ